MSVELRAEFGKLHLWVIKTLIAVDCIGATYSWHQCSWDRRAATQPNMYTHIVPSVVLGTTSVRLVRPWISCRIRTRVQLKKAMLLTPVNNIG